MQTLHLQTNIAAPLERCFFLSLSIDLHKASTIKTHEEAIAGVTTGIIGPNQTVTWRARHFGLMLTHATLISEYIQPTHFQDIMTKGAFKTFVHDHDFEALPDGTTLMRDTLRFSAPLGPFGYIAETLVLRRYLSGFLQRRNDLIKQVAESPIATWQQFLPPSE
jgi:ligand-binding SRPBCC domain-containing protein